jgi:DnaK suppressor protein
MKTRRIRQRLLERRTQLLARYRAELARADEELDSRESEEVEHATEQWDARVLTLLGDADARALERITAALRRLEAGTYGHCTECGVAIESGRLAVIPEAPVCLECALDAEAGLRRTA